MSEENVLNVFGTVKRVYSDGTADVLVDGSNSTERLSNPGGALLGSRCIVVSDGTDLFIMSASSCGSSSSGAIELTAVPVPVGSYWFTEDLRDPHMLWLGTAWESLSEGRGLVGTIDPARAGMLSGSDTLTEAQMPGHTHAQDPHKHNAYSRNHAGAIGTNDHYALNAGDVKDALTVNDTTATNQNTGGGQPHQHPHRKVFIWRRLPDTGSVEQLNLTEISERVEEFEHIVSTLELADFADALDPNKKLNFEWGSVLAINDDETLSVHIAEYSSAVTAINWAGAAVGATVGMLCRGLERLAITVKKSVLNAGAIQAYGGSFECTPAGWLPCDGATYYTADYPALYRTIGRVYTEGSVSADRFSVPDLGGRVAVGSRGTEYSPGKSAGKESHILTIEEMPCHKHDIRAEYGVPGNPSYPPYSQYAQMSASVSTAPRSEHMLTAGGSQAHNNMQPYTVVNYMISTGAGYDSTGNLITAGIANGAVTMEKLSPELAPRVESFIYTTTKKDTGRTTEDGQIIWGQAFRGNITIAASYMAEITLISGLPLVARLLNMRGGWAWHGPLENTSIMSIGGSYASGMYDSAGMRRSSGEISFSSRSIDIRKNAPYEAFVDWTDGSKRP